MMRHALAAFLILAILSVPQAAHAEPRKNKYQRKIENEAVQREQLEQQNENRLKRQKTNNQNYYDQEINLREQRKRQNEQRVRNASQDNENRLKRQENLAKRRLDSDERSSENRRDN